MMNKKRKLNINEIYNDVVDIVENLNVEFNDEFDNIFKTFNKSNSFIINRYYENDVVEYIEKNYDVVVEKKYKKSYKINNVEKYDVELIIIDPIFKNIPYDIYKIFDDKINDIDKLFECNIKDIQQLIHDQIDYMYYKNNENYINHYSIKNKYNSYDLLRLFDDIVEIVIGFNDESNDDKKIECIELITLFKYVVDELNNVDSLNKYLTYFNSNKLFKIDLKHYNYLTSNNKFNLYYYDEILYDILHNDLIENIDDEIIKLFDIDVNIDINELLFIENLYINNICNDESFDINYNIEIDDDYNYVEYSIELSIDDILKLNENIDDLKNLLFDPLNIDEIFENYNNNYNDDEFIYLLFENEYELLLNDDLYYNNCYYSIKNNKNKFDIHELKKYILNQFQHYNLKNSFKFDDELYLI